MEISVEEFMQKLRDGSFYPVAWDEEKGQIGNIWQGPYNYALKTAPFLYTMSARRSDNNHIVYAIVAYDNASKDTRKEYLDIYNAQKAKA